MRNATCAPAMAWHSTNMLRAFHCFFRESAQAWNPGPRAKHSASPNTAATANIRRFSAPSRESESYGFGCGFEGASAFKERIGTLRRETLRLLQPVDGMHHPLELR